MTKAELRELAMNAMVSTEGHVSIDAGALDAAIKAVVIAVRDEILGSRLPLRSHDREYINEMLEGITYG